jgi:hypothetical protein
MAIIKYVDRRSVFITAIDLYATGLLTIISKNAPRHNASLAQKAMRVDVKI